ncbi:MAG: hypothetical protein IKA17_11275 [Clostridia bacterium]|nr:hypothetical protein [Clostridia bacterium]
MKRYIVIFIFLTAVYLISSIIVSNKTNKQEINNAENYINPCVLIANNDECSYTNEKGGYEIIFPEEWKGKYIITEYSSGEVCIGFYGKSETSRKSYLKSLGRYGLDLGWIVDGEHIPIDGSCTIGEITEIDGVQYFLTTARGGSYIPELAITANANDNTVSENEKYLALQDSKEAVKMRDDLYDMNFKVRLIR